MNLTGLTCAPTSARARTTTGRGTAPSAGRRSPSSATWSGTGRTLAASTASSSSTGRATPPSSASSCSSRANRRWSRRRSGNSRLAPGASSSQALAKHLPSTLDPPWTLRTPAKHSPSTCQRSALDSPSTRQAPAKDLPWIVPGLSQHLPKISHLPRTRPGLAVDSPSTFPRSLEESLRTRPGPTLDSTWTRLRLTQDSLRALLGLALDSPGTCNRKSNNGGSTKSSGSDEKFCLFQSKVCWVEQKFRALPLSLVKSRLLMYSAA